MPLKRMVLEIGMGTDLGGRDYTKAAIRAVEDALWHNSLTVADAFGADRDDMKIECHIGAGEPEAIPADEDSMTDEAAEDIDADTPLADEEDAPGPENSNSIILPDEEPGR